jgi:DNA-binding transcriptional MerR regulator
MNKLLSTREVSEHLGIPVGTLRYWRMQGRGPAIFKMGPRGHVRYAVADVEAFLASCRRVPSVQANMNEPKKFRRD